MNKLWQGKESVNKLIEKFTVGMDYVLDLNILKYDILGSLAHISMLNKIGILNKNEYLKLKKTLIEIYNKNEKGEFKIELENEDCHTAIEIYLTKKLKDVGKKVHTGRSRNDQVLTAVRLFEKDNLIEVGNLILDAAYTCVSIAKKYEFIPVAGYTHYQRAMPSSFGMIFGAYTESFIDDYIFLSSVLRIIDKSPLGSAAGYGVNIPLDRSYSAKLLGFNSVQNNSLYVQNSRGKFDLLILNALTNLMLTVNKIATDFITFNTKEFDFLSLPKGFTTGSSIMSQKKNPDVFEILRSKSNLINGYSLEINSIIRNLISGYHRDYQLLKEPVIKSFHLVIESLVVLNFVLPKVQINEQKCLDSLSEEIYAADIANNLVLSGQSFRDAYQKSKDMFKSYSTNPVKNIQSKKHLGATGNLQLNKNILIINKLKKENNLKKRSFERVISNLLKS